eukprot:3031955-Pleurochrysis_carterae.AAC.4
MHLCLAGGREQKARARATVQEPCPQCVARALLLGDDPEASAPERKCSTVASSLSLAFTDFDSTHCSCLACSLHIVQHCLV